MLEKAKKFYKEHKVIILAVGGVALATVGVVLTRKGPNKSLAVSETVSAVSEATSVQAEKEWKEALEYLESIGGEIKDEICYATKEVATKFMEDMGDNYQLVMLSPEEAAIFIDRTTKVQEAV